MKIGIISDTHGLLRPEAVEALQNVQHIIHAGDVGKPEIVDRLRSIASVTVVRGNVDTGTWAAGIPTTELVEFEGKSIYVIHDIAALDVNPKAAGIHCIVYGHSHRSLIEDQNGILYINPGSAGPRRFRLPVTLAVMEIDVDITGTIINLS